MEQGRAAGAPHHLARRELHDPLVAIISLLAFTNGSFDLVNIMTKGGPLYRRRP